ncbi:2,4-dihydroxyhept-2-ene-1,7-dioic acid aldolase [Candidatus Rhodobacter oscarellae]|uniref:2,4-dihydroxyhept-2-ene-1,7-dioic acid aldolase n=1 Tax=Candidatus Rhodobacter oscarellae TaxID=1675527 RepID=A0A0J9E1R1_9RHOB|nr:aldolase/citrate lyase family protein [Candidatus Rhodobacter lobularis]KMW56612.1 2,4-dihydroxyhept-2-ene-1,7-dioic acid aldolase [Candidatus Rhodobacter lobularis]
MAGLKQKLAQDARLTGHLCTIPSATVTQALAAAGADLVVIDMEHGAVDYGSAHAMIAATAGTDCAPLVRITENDPAQVKRVLDLGAEGIVFPLIRDAQDAAKAVASLRYPPDGTRGFGPFIAQSRWGTDLMSYRETMQDRLVCVLTIETREAIDNVEAICAVPGIDMIVPAPFDLSTELGVSGQFEHPAFVAAIAKAEAAAKAAGIPLGGVALQQGQAKALFERGYRLIAGFDILWLRAATQQMAGWAES